MCVFTCEVSSPAATLKASKSDHILVYCLKVTGLKPCTILSAAEVASWAAGPGKSENYITGEELYEIIKAS